MYSATLQLLGPDVEALGFRRVDELTLENRQGYRVEARISQDMTGWIWKYDTKEPSGRSMGDGFTKAIDAARWVTNHMEPKA